MIRRLILAVALGVPLAFPAAAVEPSEMLADPKLEARAREVSKELRCVVCQNETIDESHAEIAGDMRKLVRERIMAGDSNRQIVDYMQNRYGDYVLLKPRFTATTLLLWLGPPLVLVLGLLAVRRRLKAQAAGPAPLTAEERVALAALEKDKP
jgi:cytochrome c-type biogenesis protein CcmH